uniref:Uncharacterized protein n=1 Tax=Rhizobium rhizogenes TaxID=359 RepID=A0A7S4ZTN0_RHIRH|nr:hypothetical protein pC5.8a_97 [Rhizobium rhizogenes]
MKLRKHVTRIQESIACPHKWDLEFDTQPSRVAFWSLESS